MINGRKIVVCMPAYNASKTLEKTYADIPHDIVDDVVLVDDASMDNTVEVARNLGIRHVLQHDSNKGYGGNQKTCYRKAIELEADIIIMLHPDYQYDPKLIPSIAYLLAYSIYPVVLCSRILGEGAIKNGMPFYKYFFNRVLTFIQNILLGQKLSEYHTGYRGYTREILQAINLEANSDDFVFDNQVLAQFIFNGYEIGEISCPASYFPEASSINFIRSVKYGFGVLHTSISYRLNKMKLLRSEIFNKPT
ncbi:MAG: glycosyltransferase family 2 protein [Chitinophagaceae bacterium]|nr:glycosyltransferase family 2 protein [Chitinophagaceae bacterium]